MKEFAELSDFEQEARRAEKTLRNRALEEGLIDVAYAVFDSPIGALLLASTPKGLATISYVQDPSDEIESLASRISPRILAAPKRLDEARRQLEEYFKGNRRSFELALDWSLTQGFRRRLLKATARIPYGHLTTYKQIAGRAGSPRGSRAAGGALGSNPIPIVVPCHRVVASGGGLGGYTGGLDKKRFLLAIEGVSID